jgi:aspartate/glutamate racemase
LELTLFGRLRGVTDVVPLPAATFAQVGDIYQKIVETEGASTEEFETLRSLAHRLIDHEGADVILLAGTDLAFVFRSENTDFPVSMRRGPT